MSRNAEWLYEQCRRDNALDDGVDLSFAHAMQIAGELTRMERAIERVRQSGMCCEAASVGKPCDVHCPINL
jgi:hypothetical protein